MVHRVRIFLRHLEAAGTIRDAAFDRSVVVEFLDHLDAVKFVKGSFCIVTFKNSGKYRYERMFALNRPVVFDLAPARKLKQFYEL